MTLLAPKQQHPGSRRDGGLEVEFKIPKGLPKIQATNPPNRRKEILPYLWDQDVIHVIVSDPGSDHD
jgi:hypothetical protein